MKPNKSLLSFSHSQLRLNELESAEKRKEILNGNKRAKVHFDEFYVKIREDIPLMESTFVLKTRLGIVSLRVIPTNIGFI